MTASGWDKVQGWLSLLRLILPVMVTWMLFDLSGIRSTTEQTHAAVLQLSETVTKNKEISNENYYLLSNEFKTELGGVKERLVRLETYQDVHAKPFSSAVPPASLRDAHD